MSTLETGVAEMIERLVNNAAKTTILPLPHEPAGYYAIVGPDGKAEVCLAEAPWHNETLESPSEMKRYITDRISRGYSREDSAIFYNEHGLTLFDDLSDRRDKVNCPLKRSTVFQVLSGKPLAMTQRDFHRLLRITLRGCLPDSNIVSAVKNLTWASSENGNASIAHGNESLGRQVMAKVAGESTIPEELTLQIRVFDNHNFATTIQCAIELNVVDKTFALIPYPMELTRAMENTLDDILRGLTVENFPPAFRGNA